MTETSPKYPVSSEEEMNVLVERQRASGWADLPTKHKAFAHEYLLNYKHREAAVAVGYSANTGSSLLRDPMVASYIEHLQTMQLTNNIITRDFINRQYMHLYDMAIGDEPQHCILPDGDEYMAKKTELGTAHNILDKMSKSIEYAKDAGTKSASVSVNIDMGSLFGDRNNSGDNMGSVIIDVNGENDE